MRFKHLELTRYGKFTEARLDFPQAEQDFHFITGPNEAGKSTLRQAITSLLFGFPARSAGMAFVHPQSDLRLGAGIEDRAERFLDFVRTRGTKNTLRSPSDVVIAEEALSAFLGSYDRDLFEKMFGLDHGQLVGGGREILDASSDVSQMLFQTASGVAGLGKIKEALTNEADQLWAPKASASRTYYAAHTRWDEAKKQLKTLTVRAKSWKDAQAALKDIESRNEALNDERRTLQTRRAVLERVRRLASNVQLLRSYRLELQELDEVLDLPADASDQCEKAAGKLAVAQTVVNQTTATVEQQTGKRDGAKYDAAVLAARADIEFLVAVMYRSIPQYVDRSTQQGERDACIRVASLAAAELGWPQDSDAMRQRLPDPIVLRDLQRLVTSHGTYLSVKTSAAKAVVDKQDELEKSNETLAQIAAGEVSPALRSAYLDAQVVKNTTATQAKLASAFDSAKDTLDAALVELGKWGGSLKVVQAMSPPSAERLTELVSEYNVLKSERKNAVERQREAKEALEDVDSSIEQFAKGNHIVTAAQVQAARGSRDTQWSAIKSGQVGILGGSGGLDSAIALADELVDTRLVTATEAAQLQALDSKRQAVGLKLRQWDATLAQKNTEVGDFKQQWKDLAQSCAIGGMDLPLAPAWVGRRTQVLKDAASCKDRKAELDLAVNAADHASRALLEQLVAEGVEIVEGSSLGALLLEAQTLIQQVDLAATRRETLTGQINTFKRDLGKLKSVSETASSDFEQWEADWAQAVDAVGLTLYVKSVSDVEGAAEKIRVVRTNLDKATSIQVDRIDTMVRDLHEFDELAENLVSQLGLEEEFSDWETRAIASALSERLQVAKDTALLRKEAADALETAQADLEKASNEVQHIQATIAAILTAAGVSTLEYAMPLIKRSDRKRDLQRRIAEVREDLVTGSDGLALDVVTSEVDSCDQSRIPDNLVSIESGLEEIQTKLDALSTERSQGQIAFDAIDGGQSAALAESQRQEALAEMAQAAERYIRVTTAARLLTWAIDQYRDKHQGPMLARAGTLFGALTLGQFSKLFVDYEKIPVSLSALRANGQQVEVTGMSKGTRDQLYLALRLAALEIHLEQATALPFIADDLFINFDDARSVAGLQALRDLSTRTQVIFLSHHDHLLPHVKNVFGDNVNVLNLSR